MAGSSYLTLRSLVGGRAMALLARTIYLAGTTMNGSTTAASAFGVKVRPSCSRISAAFFFYVLSFHSDMISVSRSSFDFPVAEPNWRLFDPDYDLEDIIYHGPYFIDQLDCGLMPFHGPLGYFPGPAEDDGRSRRRRGQPPFRGYLALYP